MYIQLFSCDEYNMEQPKFVVTVLWGSLAGRKFGEFGKSSLIHQTNFYLQL